MKKSKVIIPALAMLVLSTAASVTGTVAWFTANRTKTITAEGFAVVNTNSNLDVELSNGVGVNCTNDDTVTQKTGYTLTDSSFDHTNTDRPVVVPDSPRANVEKLVGIASYSEANFLRSGTIGNASVYSAFAWDITFKIQFPAAAVYDMGIFLDLSASYMHERVVITNGQQYNATIAGDYNTEPDLSGDPVTIPSSGSATSNQTLYKATPDATGKAFRIAFVPKTVAGSNIGYTKIWAANQTSANCTFTDGAQAPDPNPPYTVYALPAGSSYDANTTKVTGGSATAQALGGNKSLMCSNLNNADAVPADHTQTAAASLSGNANYLAYIPLNAGNTTSVTFTCLAWYEGTDPEIIPEAANFEQIAVGMKFAAVELAAS